MSIELRRSLAFLVLVALAVPAAAEEWGTVKGRFTLKGDAPAPVPLNANDPLCGNPKLVSEELVVGDGKAMANVVVFVRS